MADQRSRRHSVRLAIPVLAMVLASCGGSEDPVVEEAEAEAAAEETAPAVLELTQKTGSASRVVPELVAYWSAVPERVDAATLIHSQAYKADQTGDFRALTLTAKDLHDLFGVHTVSAVLVSYPEKLAARPEAFKEFNRMFRESVDYAVANPGEVGAAIAKDGKISAEYFEAWLADYSRTPGTVSAENLKAMETVWKNSEELGILKPGESPKAESVVWEHAIRVE